MNVNLLIGAIMVGASATAMALTNYTYHYWFDSSPDVTSVSAGENLTIDADVSGLTQGLHLLHCFSVNADGVQSSTSSDWFLKTFQPVAGANGKVVLHLDGKQLSVVDGDVSSEGLVNVEADLNGADCGIHTMGATFVTAEGVSTQYEERFFYRFPTTADMQTFDGYYILDASVIGSVKGGHAGAVTLDIDVTELTTGFHTLSIFMATPKGYSTNVVNSIFYKTPAGGEGIKSYRYWVNDDTSDVSSYLEGVENPLSLVTMFDMPSRPFRSRDFALDTSEGSLKLYARNTLNFQTYDTENKISFASTDYMDSRVSKPLDASEIAPLPEGIGSVKVMRPADNGIRWYSFQGEPGGLLKISADRGCITDVFAPDGERIDRAEGSDAINERNVQLMQAGTYFVAVHDFERSVNSLALSYVNLNKYAVVSTTPTETCPDGLLMMSVYGNGMNCLKSARLEKEGDTLEAIKLHADDNYSATLQFNLENEPLGTYTLVLQFSNEEDASTEDIQITDALSIVPKQAGDVTVSVIPSNRGGSNIYDITLRIENKGNVPYWGVPVNIASQLDGGEYALLYKDFFTESVSETSEYVNSSTTTGNLLNTGKTGSFEPFLLPYIGSHQTIDLTLGLIADAHTRVNIYAWCGEPWSREAEEMLAPDYDVEEVIYWPQTNMVSLKTLMCARLWFDANSGKSTKGLPAKAPADYTPPQWFDLVDFDFPHTPDASDLAERTGDIAEAIGMAIAGIYMGADMPVADALAQTVGWYQGIDDPNYIKDHPDIAAINNSKRQAMPHPLHIIATALGYGDEYEMMARYQNGCPNSPTPHASPNQVEMLGPCDPNDMYGYIAPGGGNHVGLEVKTLDYTIEFENDPELANASALTVKVHNKLDGNVFDLASLVTREVIIGNKKISVPDSHRWVRTIDMRPEINGVAQVSFNYDSVTGDANWELSSLDPMSMETTDVINQGFLPVNNDSGDGIGFLSYSVNLKENLADNTEISNKATIIFDANEPIETPSYLNVTDYQRPASRIVNTETNDNRTFTFTVEGEDDGSGIWFYNLYMRNVDDADWKLAGSNYEENTFTYSVPGAVENTQFMVIAYDRAGNVQDGTLVDVKLGDADGNGVVNANDAVIIRNYYVGKTDVINMLGADASCDGKINAQDALAVRTIYIGKTKIKQLNKLRKRKYAN